MVLRYVHDIVGEEFVNVGLLLLCPERKFIEFRVASRTARLRQFFPSARTLVMRNALSSAKKSAAAAKGLFSGISGPSEQRESILDMARKVVAFDDSGLQWSSVTTGLTADPAATFDRLFDRLVLRYEAEHQKSKRTDDQVWRVFSKVLEKRNVSALIQEHEVTAKLETVTFKHALKNGKWHVMEPVSFDLTTAESLTDKAKRLLGEMTLLRESQQDFRLYFLVGQPSSPEVMDAYDRALKILDQVPLEKEIVLETQAEQFATMLARIAANDSMPRLRQN